MAPRLADALSVHVSKATVVISLLMSSTKYGVSTPPFSWGEFTMTYRSRERS